MYKIPIKIKCIDCGNEILAYQPFRKYCGNRKDLNSCMYKRQLEMSKKSYEKSRKEGRYVTKYDPMTDRKRKLKRNFDLTMEEYKSMFIRQNGVCLICGKKEYSRHTSYLAVDHDHKTGKVRGLLCGRCNKGIGFFSDDTNLLKKAIDYLLTRC